MSKNDDRILVLKKLIEEKKKALLERKVRFTPVTNCILTLGQQTYNLNVCDEDVLTMLMVRLNLYLMSAKELDVTLPKFNDYDIKVWIDDIKNKLEVLSYKKEEKELKANQEKLDKLLSDEKRVELEIDEIATMLG